MTLAYNATSNKNVFLVDNNIFSQTLDILRTRAKPLGIKVLPIDLDKFELEDFDNAFGLVVQLPNNHGRIKHPDGLLRCAEVYKCIKIAIVDPLAQVLMQPVGEMGFDIAVGSMQRFGIPMGCLLYTSDAADE